MRIAAIVVLVSAAVVIGGALWLYTPDKPRAELERAYAGPPSEFVEVLGMRMHVRDTGPRDAPALVLLHGFGSSLHTWDAWAGPLDAKYRVIRFDLPGFGLTGPDPSDDYSDARGMQVLGALMNALAVPRATLIGNSMGGKLAWLFAAERPERVNKLVLIAPDGFASPGFEYGKAPEVPFFVRLLPYTLPSFMVRMNLAPAFGNSSALTDELLARYRDMMLAPGVRGAMIERMRQVRLEPPEALLRRIQAPTLLIWGERDAMIPLRNAGDYLKSLPDARLAAFPDLGHVPQEEAPMKSLAPLKSFLSGVAFVGERTTQ